MGRPTDKQLAPFPVIRAAMAELGVHLWLTPPNPTKVWLAEMHGEWGSRTLPTGYADTAYARISTTGATELEALSNLETLLTRIKGGTT